MEIKSKQSNSNYIDQLTWLRGFAAFLVIVSHVLHATRVTYTAHDEASSFLPLALLDLGSFGVTIFFALSGCTLYISYSDKLKASNTISYYIKRLFRIWPAFFVSLIIYIVFRIIFAELYVEPQQGYWIERQFLEPYTLTHLFSYLTLTFNITGPTSIFNSVYWTLPVEFQYYLIFPLIIVSLRYLGAAGPIIIGFILFLLPKYGIVDLDRNEFFTLAYSFCGGVLAGYFYKKYTYRMNFKVGMLAFFAIFATISVITNKFITIPDVTILSSIWNWYSVLSILTVYIVLVTKINLHSKIKSFLKHYGTISYSTYLYHNLFVAIATLILIHLEVHDADLRLAFTFFFTVLATYLAAVLSYNYIESPFVLVGKKVASSNFKKIISNFKKTIFSLSFIKMYIENLAKIPKTRKRD